MKRFYNICIGISIAISSLSLKAQEPEPIKLWQNDSIETEITIYPADSSKNTGMGIVVCPGGSYAFVSMSNEGTPVGKWLSENGITAIVLNYRIPQYDRNRPISDARQAIRYMRNHASEYGIDMHNVGIWGSSAGGHLASTISTHFEDSLSHPDFTILYYPVISSRADLTHKRSFKNLLGENPTPCDRGDFSNELQVDGNTPPTLMILSDDDPTVNPLNSVAYYEALKRYSIPAAMYIFPVGKHGYGFKEEFPYQSISRQLILDWLTRDKQ